MTKIRVTISHADLARALGVENVFSVIVSREKKLCTDEIDFPKTITLDAEPVTQDCDK